LKTINGFIVLDAATVGAQTIARDAFSRAAKRLDIPEASDTWQSYRACWQKFGEGTFNQSHTTLGAMRELGWQLQPAAARTQVWEAPPSLALIDAFAKMGVRIGAQSEKTRGARR
jgi:hypothetical protein